MTPGVPSRPLATHGVIDTDLGDRLVWAAGFRNVLVHGYVDVDDERVLSALDDLADLWLFIEQVRSWARAQTG